GLDPKLVAHRAPRGLEHLERFGLPITPVEGDHQLPAEPLAARVLRDQCPELPNQIAMTPERQVAFDAVLERRQPQLVEPSGLSLCERLIANVLIRGSAPQF